MPSGGVPLTEACVCAGCSGSTTRLTGAVATPCAVYALNPAPLAKAASWLEGYRAFWQRNLDSLKRYLEDT